MGVLDGILNAFRKGLKLSVEPPRSVRDHERYPGLGPLRWWDKIGPETFRCRVCGHTTRTWRGMQSHTRLQGHRRPTELGLTKS